MIKKYSLKNNKGITLPVLVTTVIILLILATTAIYNGMDSIDETRKTAFIQELQIVQGQVNIIYEKVRTGEIDYINYLTEFSVTENIDVIQNHSTSSYTEFRLISGRDNLLKIGIDGLNSSFYINFKTAEVISKDGLTIDNESFYSLKDFGYSQIVNTTAKITSSVSVDNTIKVSVEYPVNSIERKISYSYDGSEISSTDYTGEITVDNNTSITVTFKFIDNDTIISQEEVIAYRNLTSRGTHNSPKLASGMTPIILNSDNIWEVTTQDDVNWYNYESNSFAHIKLNDGSIFMWVPRFTVNNGNYIFSNGLEGNTTNSTFYDEKSNKELLGIWVAKYPSSQSNLPYIIQSIYKVTYPNSIYDLKNKISHMTDYTYIYGLYPSEVNTFIIDTTRESELQTILENTNLNNRIAISVF